MEDREKTKEQLIEELEELRRRSADMEKLEARCIEENEALRLSEEKFSKVYHSSPDWIVISTLDEGMFINVNDAFLRITGYKEEEVLGRTATELGIWADPDERDRMISIISEEGKIRDHEVQFRMKSGEVRTMLRSAEVIELEGRKCIISVTHDITERKIAADKLKVFAEELERRNRELEQFAYIVSHDLQAPLVTVGGYLRLLQRRYKDKLDQKAAEFIENSIDGTDRMQALIKSLLEYARISSGGTDYSMVDSETILCQAVDNLRALIEEKGAVIKHDSLPEVAANPVQLTQLFQNLIGNAIKFNNHTPEISIAAERRDGEWMYSVKDNGIGIPDDQIALVFEVFHRTTDHVEYEGTGIGLAVCKKIVERHNGRIWAESEPGKGTTFYFTIPGESA